MTKLLQQAVAEIEILPDEEQDRAAEVLFALAAEPRRYQLTPVQVAGVQHAMLQADRREFANDIEVKEIFGRSL